MERMGKKEIGTLIKLLDIFLKDKREYSTYDFDIIKIRHYYKLSGLYEHLDEIESQALIISKEFGFIKWLVENDKIDIEKIENSEYYLIDWFYYNERKKFGIEWLDDVEKILLMLLSISDTPIEDLISYLK